jgi:ABC-type dipeptide/oligopeptide/nickel transport system permease component
MGQYIIRRILQAIPLLILIAVLVFFLIQVSGDPTAEMAANPRFNEADIALERARLGLNAIILATVSLTALASSAGFCAATLAKATASKTPWSKWSPSACRIHFY